jgi:hypothetical protein
VKGEGRGASAVRPVAGTAAAAAALAAPGEILVSRMVVDLVPGSGLAFSETGRRFEQSGVEWLTLAPAQA